MGKKIIIGNIKMNMTPNDFIDYITKLKNNINSDNKIILCVPYIDIPYIGQIKANKKIYISSQNVHYKEKGAYTGEISVKMLKSIGVEYVLIGHPERRHIFKEKDKIINQKIIKSLNNGLKVILCVENINQLKRDLKNIDQNQLKNIIFIYESLKTIGKNKVVNYKKIEKQINRYYNYILKKYKNKQEIKIGYGGSINFDSINQLKNIDVLLIGSACLNVEEFIKIINNI